MASSHDLFSLIDSFIDDAARTIIPDLNEALACQQRLNRAPAEVVAKGRASIRRLESIVSKVNVELDRARQLQQESDQRNRELAAAQADALVHSAEIIEELEETKEALREAHQAEEAARWAAERAGSLGRILDRSGSEIYVFDDRSLKFVYANQGAQSNIGYSTDELCEMKPYDIKPEFSADEFEELLVPLRNGASSTIRFTATHIRKDGSTYPVEGTIQDSIFEGRPAFVVVILDISEQRKSEEQLRKLSAAVEQSPVAIMIADNSGTIEYINPQFTEMTGYTEAETIGRNPSMLNSGKTPRETFTQMWNTLGKGEVWHGEFRNKKKNGELYWESGTTAPIRNELGQTTHFVALKEDTTKTKQMQINLVQAKREAESANRSKSEFLANMSHEIRTPLNGVIGFTDLLIQEGTRLPDTERLDYLKSVRSSGKHLLSLINDILDLSKIESGKLELERIEYSPHAMMAEVVSLFRVTAMEKGLRLDSEWIGAFPKTICTDPTRLRQLLVNLIGNAIKFTAKGSVRLVTQLKQEGDKHLMQVDIIDTGVGIESDKLEAIFAPFSQADNSVTRQFGGTGLGLTISRRLVKALGGDLTIQSELGVGSTFTITIDVGSIEGIEMVESQDSDGITQYATSNNNGGVTVALNLIELLSRPAAV
jgi:PAS domain S-box-containing protein